jgi:hypothetical protein
MFHLLVATALAAITGEPTTVLCGVPNENSRGTFLLDADLAHVLVTDAAVHDALAPHFDTGVVVCVETTYTPGRGHLLAGAAAVIGRQAFHGGVVIRRDDGFALRSEAGELRLVPRDGDVAAALSRRAERGTEVAVRGVFDLHGALQVLRPGDIERLEF